MSVPAIVIGRNEGERLVRCLAALESQLAPVIYVDSGSIDGSVDAARDAGAEIVELDMSSPFTAARARNAGLKRLAHVVPRAEFVQFLDGDCELRDGWIEAAMRAIRAGDDIAVVCGRRRERFPEASVYNRLIDAEWDTPVGEAKSCGGDALMRRAALDEVGGFRDDLIAGEEPEMCYRMRLKGWRIVRIEAEMTWHDAAITRFGQWWQRNHRAGHAFAEGAAIHGAGPERFWVSETRRALIWGAGMPTVAGIGAIILPAWTLLILLAWPAQVVRIRARGLSWERAVSLTLGKVPEACGVLDYWINRLVGRRKRIIEYK